jgi:hypothetical protein
MRTSEGWEAVVAWPRRSSMSSRIVLLYKCGERAPFRFQNEIDQMNWFYDW